MIGPVLFCLLAFAIYRQLVRQPNWHISLQQAKQALWNAPAWKLITVVALMLGNWACEARKWQLVIGKMHPISFLTSWKAVFTGTTLAFFTPNRIGEYMGRILYIPQGMRIKAISLTLVCSMAQLLVTWAAGIIGLLFCKAVLEDTGNISGIFWTNTVLYFTLAGAVILTLLYFRLAWLVKWVEKIPRIERFVSVIRLLDSFNATILWRILSISIFRYGIFIAQYYLLFDVFNVPLTPLQVFGSISVVFLVLSIVPTIAVITELGVRWEASIEVVQLFSTNVTGILATSLALWIINLVIPALIGSLLILGIKIFTNRK